MVIETLRQVASRTRVATASKYIVNDGEAANYRTNARSISKSRGRHWLYEVDATEIC